MLPAPLDFGRKKSLCLPPLPLLRLRVEFEPYSCDKCHGQLISERDYQGLSMLERNRASGVGDDNTVFQNALKILFTSLSTWEKPDDVSPKGLCLELAMYSPSDSEHAFSDLNLAHDPYSEAPEQFRDLRVYKDGNGKEQDDQHPYRWLRRRDPQAPPPPFQESVDAFMSVLKIMGGPVSYHLRPRPALVMPQYRLSEICLSPGYLPQAPVVTKFLLRRQYYRQIRPTHFQRLLISMPSLESINLETPEPIPWLQHVHEHCKPQNDATPPRVHRGPTILTFAVLPGFLFDLGAHMPPTLKRLTVYEDSEEDFHSMLRSLAPSSNSSGLLSNYTPRQNVPLGGQWLALGSRHLEHLAASFTVSAENFLLYHWPERASLTDVGLAEMLHWPHLETLALTSVLLASPTAAASPLVLNELFEAASLAARDMPRLRTMELWHGSGDEHGCFFRFHHDGEARSAELIWSASWQLHIAPRVVRSWRETVRQRAGEVCQVHVRVDEMEMDGTRFPASVLRQLILKDRIVHKVVCKILMSWRVKPPPPPRKKESPNYYQGCILGRLMTCASDGRARRKNRVENSP